MIVVPARVLPAPKLKYCNLSDAVSVETAPFASWNLKGKRFYLRKTIPKWTTLTVGDGAHMNGDKLHQFEIVFEKLGLQDHKAVTDCNLKGIKGACDYSGRKNLEDGLKAAFEAAKKKGVGLLIVVLGSKDAYRYGKIKYWGDLKHAIHTICVLSKNLKTGDKIDETYYANVALKVNTKIGGTKHILAGGRDDEFPLDEKEKETMIVGIDVTHPAPKGMTGTPSIVAVVANVDDNFTQWPRSVRCQEGK